MGNRTNTKLVAVIVILIISRSVIVLGAPNYTTNQQTGSRPLQQRNLIAREKIYINSNTGFQEFPGSGTEEDPYIIAGFEISSPVSEDYNLITIEGTTAYFVITSNILTGNNQNSGSGIVILSASNGLIRYNEVRDNTNWGIFIADSVNIIVEYNIVVSNSHQGLELLSARYNIIRYNIVDSNGANGIASYFSDNNIIFNNTVKSNSQNGIHIEEGVSHNINGNLVDSNNGDGIWFGGGKSNILESNEISSNSAGITFRDQTQLGYNPSENNLVTNNLIANNARGIELSGGNNNTFSQNLIDGSEGNGIQFTRGENNSIMYNVISNNEYGYRSTGSGIRNTTNCNSFELNRGFGVLIDVDSEQESIFRNDFSNNLNNPQASDNGFSNTFENNYWSDIGNQDQDEDGINDIEYTIDGSAGNADFSSSPIKNTDLSDDNSICNLEEDIADIEESFENITKSLELESRLELPVSRFVLISFPILIVLVIGIVAFYRRKGVSIYNQKSRLN